MPTTMGVTGKTIGLRKIKNYPRGEMEQEYLGDVDNFMGIRGGIRDMVVVPLFDRSQKLRGVIQLINTLEPNVHSRLGKFELVC